MFQPENAPVHESLNKQSHGCALKIYWKAFPEKWGLTADLEHDAKST